MAKKFYVSGIVDKITLDLGREIEAENAFMAAVQFHKGMSNIFPADKGVTVTGVEEIANV